MIAMDAKYAIIGEESKYFKIWINTLLINDIFWTKLGNFEKNAEVIAYRNYLKKGEYNRQGYNKLIFAYQEKMNGTN